MHFSLLKLTRGNADTIGRSNPQACFQNALIGFKMRNDFENCSKRESLMKLQERIELLKYHTPSKQVFNGTIVDEWTEKAGFLQK